MSTDYYSYPTNQMRSGSKKASGKSFLCIKDFVSISTKSSETAEVNLPPYVLLVSFEISLNGLNEIILCKMARNVEKTGFLLRKLDFLTFLRYFFQISDCLKKLGLMRRNFLDRTIHDLTPRHRPRRLGLWGF